MQYLLLIYGEESMFEKMTPEQQQQGAAAYMAYTEALKAAGTAGGSEEAEKKAEEWQQASKAGDLPRGKPGPGTVWVDASTKIYYRQSDRMYGKTNKGAYMSEGDAVNSGYHDSTEKPAKK